MVEILEASYFILLNYLGVFYAIMMQNSIFKTLMIRVWANLKKMTGFDDTICGLNLRIMNMCLNLVRATG